jgi:hypothetical protein
MDVKFTTTDLSNCDKRCSDAHFVSFLFHYLPVAGLGINRVYKACCTAQGQVTAQGQLTAQAAH